MNDTPTKHTHHFPDLGYAARLWFDNEVVIAFELFGCDFATDGTPLYHNGMHPVESIEEAEIEVSGHVKWDGCSDFGTDDGIHVCHRDDLADFGAALLAVYDKAREMLGKEWKGD